MPIRDKVFLVIVVVFIFFLGRAEYASIEIDRQRAIYKSVSCAMNIELRNKLFGSVKNDLILNCGDDLSNSDICSSGYACVLDGVGQNVIDRYYIREKQVQKNVGKCAACVFVWYFARGGTNLLDRLVGGCPDFQLRISSQVFENKELLSVVKDVVMNPSIYLSDEEAEFVLSFSHRGSAFNKFLYFLSFNWIENLSDVVGSVKFRIVNYDENNAMWPSRGFESKVNKLKDVFSQCL